MPSRFLLCAAVVVLSLFPVTSSAAECDFVHPYDFQVTSSCTSAGGLCPIGQPVTFSLFSYGDPKHCATVKWQFADGSPDLTVSGDQVVTHSFAAAGTYAVKATIKTTFYTFVRDLTTTVAVGHGHVSARGANVLEGNTASLLISRSNIIGDSEVAWVIEKHDGSPAVGVTPSSGTVLIPAGAVSVPLTIATTEDAIYTGSRSFRLRLTSATNGYLVPSGEAASLTIEEDDFAIIGVPGSNPYFTVREDAGMATIPLTRTGDLSSTVAISYWTWSWTAGIVSGSGTVTFAPGQTTGSLNFAVINDSVRTPDRLVSVHLDALSAGVRFSNSTWGNSSFTFRIEDDDPPDTLTAENISVMEGDTGSHTVKLIFKLSRPQTSGFSVSYSIGGTATWNRDYTHTGYSSGYLGFPAGTTERALEFDVHGDDDVEGHETIRITLYSYSGMPVTVPATQPTITILNDDAGFGPSHVRVEKGGTGNAVVDFGGPVSSPMVFSLASSNPAIASVPSTVTIATGQNAVAFKIRGHASGAARITATPPPGLGEPMSIVAQVHDAARLVFDPPSVLVQPDGEITVRASLDPPSATDQKIRVKSVNPAIATVEDWLIIPAGGQGALVVHGKSAGGTSITATLPEELGEKTALLNVTVEKAGTTTSLHSIVPSTGPAAGGTPFEANGVLLTPDCTLLFGGVPATGVHFVSESLLTGTTPSHAAGTTDVELQCGTKSSVLRNGFTYLAAPPALTAISPSFGSTRGGTHVRVAATNVRSGCWLFLDGVAATGVETHGTTELTAIVPARANLGTVAASIRCGDATGTLANAFTYSNAAEPSASIMNIAPMAAAPGETVTVTGSRFRPTDRITFDDVRASAIRTLPDAHLLRVPELPLGLASITLTDAENRATTTGPIFTVLEPERPSIAAASPAATVAGAEVELTGRAFRAAYSFAVGGRPARTVVLEPQRVVLRLAANLEPGVHAIQLLNANGQVAVIGPSLTINSGGLVVRSVEPGCGSTEGGVEAVIHGDGFLAGAAVTFNGVAATHPEVVDANTIRVTIPAGATGFARIAVTNLDGTTATINDGFRYRSPFDPEGCVPASPRGRSVRH